MITGMEEEHRAMESIIRSSSSTQEMRDNNTNEMTEEHVPSAINRVLNNPVQSYDAFMDSFLVLRKEDVEKYIPHSDDYPDFLQEYCHSNHEYIQPSHGILHPANVQCRSSDDGVCSEIVISRCNTEEVHAIDLQEHSCQKCEASPTDLSSDEDLQTEELDEGFSSLKTPRECLQHKGFVQVDNFVDVEMSSDDEDRSSSDDVCKLLDDMDINWESVPGGCTKLTISLKPEIYKESQEGCTDILETAEIETMGKVVVRNYPGEVEEVSEKRTAYSVPTHETRLSVGTSSDVTDPLYDAQDHCSDDVQPFVLDPDFDYDNVELIPKWDHGGPMPQPPPNPN